MDTDTIILFLSLRLDEIKNALTGTSIVSFVLAGVSVPFMLSLAEGSDCKIKKLLIPSVILLFLCLVSVYINSFIPSEKEARNLISTTKQCDAETSWVEFDKNDKSTYPTEGIPIIVFCENEQRIIIYSKNIGWMWKDQSIFWRPLPNPPIESNE